MELLKKRAFRSRESSDIYQQYQENYYENTRVRSEKRKVKKIGSIFALRVSDRACKIYNLRWIIEPESVGRLYFFLHRNTTP